MDYDRCNYFTLDMFIDGELTKSMLEIRTLLYGNGESEPNKDTCAQLTQEFFREDMFRLLIASLSKLNLEVSNLATIYASS